MIPVRPQATLIAWTHFQAPPDVPWSTDADGGQALVEFAGRACYQSWNKPNPATATNAGYIDHLLEVGHYSVLEHGTATFYFTGVSRSFTHELIRHRHFSYSQLSQRYVPDDGHVVVPEHIVQDPQLMGLFTRAAVLTEQIYQDLAVGLQRRIGDAPDQWEGCADPASCPTAAEQHRPDPWQHPIRARATLTRKQARQAARAVLPNATETRIVVTGNYRAWRHFIAMRATEHADVEIRQLALTVLAQLKTAARNVFDDIRVSVLPDGTTIATSPYQERS